MNIRVAEGPVPKHVQLRDILARLVERELAPDSRVPSERELVARYGVSRATVREAIGQLVREGSLYRVGRKGTFVAGPRVESQLHLASFTQDMRQRGHEVTTVVLKAELVHEPPDAVSSALRSTSGARRPTPAANRPRAAYRLDRLRLADGLPMAHEHGWYAADVLPDLLAHDLAGSLYELLAQVYGQRIDAASQTVWAEVADPDHARLLRIRPGAPLLTFARTSFAAHRAVEHVTSWYRGDRYQVHMTLDPAGAGRRSGPPSPHESAGGPG